MYGYLASFGDRYSVLAAGVVQGDSPSGVAALEFMEYSAKQQGQALSENDIKMGIAQGYLGTLFSIADNNVGVVSREIRADEAKLFRDRVFEDSGLGNDAWPLAGHCSNADRFLF